MIYIRTPVDMTFTLGFEPTDTIKTLKQKIQDEAFDRRLVTDKTEGFHPDRQTLFHAGTVLEDSWTLSDCDVRIESTLCLLLSARDSAPAPRTARAATTEPSTQQAAEDVSWGGAAG